VAKKSVKKSYLKSLACVLAIYFHHRLKIYEKNIDLFVAPSRFVKNILVEAGFSEKKIKVLPHFASGADIRLPRNPQTNKGKPYALYSGRISEEKNVNELIEIFKNSPINLVLAGHKDENFKIPNDPNISYAGFKKFAELEKIIQNCRFAVSASRLPETFGLIALEAIRNEKPFIGYKTGAYGEIIENNVNGYLAKSAKDMKDKIFAYADGKIPEFGFQAEKYDPSRYCQKILDIFRSVC